MNGPDPIAVVDGQNVEHLPASLYIPPDAMRVFLERFTGPLDLLLYLVRRDRIDMRDVPVADLTKQYIAYVEQVVELQLDLAAEYLMMSAILIEIKTRMLLPRQEQEEEEGEDPRAELVRRLIEYERIKLAAEQVGELPRLGRDFCVARIPPVLTTNLKPKIDAEELKLALEAAMERKSMPSQELTLGRERITLREAMTIVMGELSARGKTSFYRLFGGDGPAKEQVGVMLMAVLELANERLLELRQKNWDAEIDLRLSRRRKNAS